MTTITFDTLKYVERLRAAGVPDAQAKAEAEALAEVLASGGQDLATKGDLRDLERRLEGRILEMRYDLLKWVVGLALAQMGLLIGILVKIL
jgi:hypothetical protein